MKIRSAPKRSSRRLASAAALIVVPLALLALVSCGDDDDDETPDPGAGRAGSSAGRPAGEAGADEPGGGRAGGGVGGTGGSAARAGGGSAGSRGGSGGVVQPAAGDSSGGAADGMPPAPQPDGTSPYATECRGDSLDCNDPALRCLGLRDPNTSAVLGYSCSNECQTIDDCSSAPSGAEATAGCVDFAIAKHCMLVCREGTVERTCPTDMSCYSYPGNPIGYCLYR